MIALSLLLALQATGAKVGEVSPTSAVVWVRATARPERQADGACPGAAARVRVRYGTRPDLSDARATDWAEAREATDFARQFTLGGLEPATVYHYAAEVEGKPPLRGRFETAPPADREAEVAFTVITGKAYKDMDHPDGFHMYEAMRKLRPKFIVPTGDTVYYDNDPPNATTTALARLHWQRMYSPPRHVAFHLEVPGYWEKDDHDTVLNDCWPTMDVSRMAPLTFKEGQRIFLEQVPMGASTHRSTRWGKDLEVWFVEGRDFRSPNNAPDGPDKSIWGAGQKEWLKKGLLESTATWKVLVSPTPIVGPDRGNKGDNHANRAFKHEGDEIRRWFREKLPGNLFIACGDRHWQYHSVDPQTGVQEYSCGPASDKHAGGSPGENRAFHRFHRVKGGFLSVTAGRREGRPSIAFRFHDVHGNVVYESVHGR